MLPLAKRQMDKRSKTGKGDKNLAEYHCWWSQLKASTSQRSGLENQNKTHTKTTFILLCLVLFFCVPLLGGVADVTVLNSSATWAATIRLRGYKLFWCFHNPPNSDRPDITVMVDWALKIDYLSIYLPNSDMDCRIFHVRTCAFRMRAYTHGGLGTPTASQHNLFDSEKLKSFSYALDGIRTLDLRISNRNSLTTEPTRHPVRCVFWPEQLLRTSSSSSFYLTSIHTMVILDRS